MPRGPQPKLLVDGKDLENLRASGLTDDTIIENDLRTERDSSTLAAILNCGDAAYRCQGGLVIPYRDVDGNVNCFARVRPHFPRTRDGKSIKYEQPRGSTPRAYFPLGTIAALRESEVPLSFTEGEKKALATTQAGHPSIGLGGVWCWCKKGTDELIDDLAAIDWHGRDVFIVFDYDEKADTRRQVRTAAQRLAKALKAAGASEVFSVDLPPGTDGGKQGADDFLVAHGTEAFNELVEQAQPALVDDPDNKVIKIILVSPPELGEAAYLGLIGEFLRAVEPYTEATDAGILAHLLPAVGTLLGPGPHVWAGNNQPARINTVLVGPTNAGRKGTAAGPVDLVMQRVDRGFWSRQRVSGLSSGEGLIAYVADKEETDKDGQKVVLATEKRLYVVEEEFSRVLAQIRRDGNILSQIIRSCYDNGNLATLTVNPRHASGAHVSIVGHITPEELAERLDHVEMANGFANRFLWFLVRSEKIMPRTKPIPDSVFLPFEPRLRTLQMIGARGRAQPVEMNAEAASFWEKLYPELREDSPGLAGAIVSRGSSMVMRMALIYAALDAEIKSNKFKIPEFDDLTIRLEHLKAAQAVWDYCRSSAVTLFQSETGDKLCDKLLMLLSSGPMTKNDFNNHLSVKQKAAVGRALEKLEDWKLIKKVTVKRQGAGRPALRWERIV